MGEWAERYMARIHERWKMELDTIGTEITEEVRQNISKPVEGSGYDAVRSNPGEPPRKEKGHLWASQDHDVRDAATGPVLDMINSAEYAYKLDVLGIPSKKHGGTFTRPFFTVAADRWLRQIGPRLVDSLRGL